MIEAVLFDLDGTLVDTALDFLEVLNQLIHQSGGTRLKYVDLRLWVGQGADAMLKQAFGIEPKDAGFAALKLKFLNNYKASIGQHAQIFPGIPSLLNRLDSLKISWGIVTNKDRVFTQLLVQHLPILNTPCIVSGDDISPRKPRPQPLWHACELLNIAPKNCVYIGDAERDIIAGRVAGMKTILTTYGYVGDVESAKQWGADAMVSHADEILATLECWGMS